MKQANHKMINTIRCKYSNQNHKEGKIMAVKNCKKDRKSLFNG